MIKTLSSWRNKIIIYFNTGKIQNYIDKILSCEETGRFHESLDLAKKMLQLYPRGPEHTAICLGIAQSALKLGVFADTVKYSTLALADKPQHRAALCCLARAQTGQGELDAALRTINKAIRLLWRAYRREQKALNLKAAAREDIPALYSARAEAYMQRGEFSAGIRDYLLVRRVHSGGEFLANFNLGCAYAQARRPEAARAAFAECLRLQPENELAQCNYEIMQEIQKINAHVASAEHTLKNAESNGRGPTHTNEYFYQQVQRFTDRVKKIEAKNSRAGVGGRE